MSRHIFVTGGVVSSLGKGLTAASIGLLLESRGVRVRLQKLDPYLNVDAGTMNPFQHGEVYVTPDGAETDLDLGHYERFTKGVVDRNSNFTAGRIYRTILEKERRGDYLGGTIQVIPHVTNEIKEALRVVATDDADVVITEVGGTVGDIESLPFLEAIRQWGLEVGRGRVAYVHLTLLPFLRAAGEVKTKPSQHSVAQLREIGIQPDVLICRTEVPMDEGIRGKLSMFCNVPRDAVIEERDVEVSIYEVPLVLARQGLDDLLVKMLGLTTAHERNLDEWTRILEILRSPRETVEIAVVGKYIALHDAYKSIYESLAHGGIAHGVRVKIRKVSSEAIERDGPEAHLRGAAGILVPGGFGDRGIEGKVTAARYARERKVPYYGLCLGMQIATIEMARNACGLSGAHSTEFAPGTPHPVITLMDAQKEVTAKGGTMRLGAYACRLTPGTKAARAYGVPEVRERHRHRFELNNRYRAALAERGMIFSGVNPELDLVEIVELADHPWFVAVQFHPEYQSKPTAPHPLFRDFVGAAVEQQHREVATARQASAAQSPTEAIRN
ncbi:MAG: CTP synthase [Planctomycetales bacterium]|nr:CTP synthase [Planctomycetales bacterium]